MLFFTTAVSAEFYKYLDKDGNVRFTNDYFQIPKDQRDGMQEYSEYQKKTGEAAERTEKAEPSELDKFLEDLSKN